MNHETVDMVLLNAKVITVDSKDSIGEAVAVKNNKIVKVSTNGEAKTLIGDRTKTIDLKGKTLLPGFIDAHAHLAHDSIMPSISLTYYVNARVPPNRTINDILERIEERTKEKPKGELIVAHGNFFLIPKLIDKRPPTKEEVDKVSPDHPVLLIMSNNLYLANTKALEYAGITKDTRDPAGARIIKDGQTGEPTGYLWGYFGHFPFPSFTYEQRKEALETYIREWVVKHGITTAHIFPDSSEMRLCKNLLEEGKLPLRLVAIPMLIPNFEIGLDSLLNLGIRQGFGNEWLKIGGIKWIVDGALMGLSAATYKPYRDNPDNYGLLRYTPEKLKNMIEKAHRAGLRACIHAYGDKAQDMVLDAFEEGLKVIPQEDHRHRVEHMGNFFTSKERIRRAKKLGLIPVPNPEFLYAEGDFIEYYQGAEIAKQSFPLRSMIDEGLRPALGSDTAGSEPPNLANNPLFGISCVVTRKTFFGNVLVPEEEAVSVMDAIRMYTINGAYAGFEEEIKGSIEPGKLADMVVLSDDILTISREKIKDVKVAMTIIDGKIVYQK